MLKGSLKVLLITFFLSENAEFCEDKLRTQIGSMNVI